MDELKQNTPDKTNNEQKMEVTSPLNETPVKVTPQRSSGSVVVLQWLTYLFWFWLSISMGWLGGVVIRYFTNGGAADGSSNGQLAYSLASVIVLLAVVLVVDHFYAKHEPERKAGGANVIMLLHVIPFAITAVGALVVAVFSLVKMFVDTDPLANTSDNVASMLTALLIAVLFTLISVRAFLGGRPKVRKIVRWTGIVLAVVLVIAGFAGPGMNTMRGKQDRLIELYLPTVSDDIGDYVRDNNKLPTSLSALKDSSSPSQSDQGAAKLIDESLVTYKANTHPAGTDVAEADDDSVSSKLKIYTAKPQKFYYQLCVDYKYALKSKYSDTSGSVTHTTSKNDVGDVADYKTSSLYSISAHPAGTVCYNLYATGTSSGLEAY